MPRRTALLLVAAVVGAGVVAAGLVWWRADDTPALTNAEVVVIGDSVTDLSATRIEAEVDGGDVVVAGFPGYRTGDLLPIITGAVAGDDPPDVAVVMAGYNDVWKGQEDEAEVEGSMEALAHADCAVWVLVPLEGPWPHDRAEAFQQRVLDAADAAGVHVETGWRDAVDGTEGPEPDPQLVIGDGVHPNDAGQQRVAEVMASAVDRYCG